MKFLCKILGHWYHITRVLHYRQIKGNKILRQYPIVEMECNRCGHEMCRIDQELTPQLKSQHDDLMFETQVRKYFDQPMVDDLKDCGITINQPVQ